jgi:heme/copper-type cytochrome/quinol oxidase subunit 2
MVPVRQGRQGQSLMWQKQERLFKWVIATIVMVVVVVLIVVVMMVGVVMSRV